MEQIVTYNGFAAPFHTLSYNSVNEVNESGTLTGTRYDITLKGWVTAGFGDETLADAINRIRFNWNVPRKKLKIAWTPPGGTEHLVFLFGSPADDVEVRDPDSELGPIPRGVNVREINGGLTAEYEFYVTARTKEAWQGLGAHTQAYIAQNPISSLNRSQTFDVDQDGFTTRTVSGRLTVVSNVLGQNKGASFYRDVVAPPLPDGFVRQSQTFDVEPSGLAATFRFVDREAGSTPPYFMTSSQAVLDSSTDRRGGLARFTMTGAFGAPKTVSKAQILNAITSLVRAKVDTAGGAIIESRNISTDLYAGNSVRFRYTWTVPKIVPLGTGFSPAVKPLLEPPPDSNGRATVVSPYGTAGLTEYVLKKPYDPTTTTIADLKNLLSRKALAPPSTTSSDKPSITPGTLPEPGSDVSAANKKTPILEFVHCRGFSFDNNTAVFWPQNGDGPIFQQKGSPKLFIIDSGVIRFAGKSWADGRALLPAPPRGCRVLTFDPTPQAATPIGDGEWNEYRLAFRYVSVYTKKISQEYVGALTLEFPIDIRRGSAAVELFNAPDGLIVVDK